MSRPTRFRVVESEDGTMLFQLLARRLSQIDNDQAKQLVKAGAVYMGHLRMRIPTMRVTTGERITVYPEALDKEELSRCASSIVIPPSWSSTSRRASPWPRPATAPAAP